MRNKRDTDTDHNQDTKVHVNGVNNSECTLYVNDVMKSLYSQCFCHSEKSDINAVCVADSWKMFMHVCTLLMCLLTHVLLGFLCCCFIMCIKVFVRNMFVTEGEMYFYHRNDLTELELRLMCLAFFRALTLCVCVCVLFFCFFSSVKERNITGWSQLRPQWV